MKFPVIKWPTAGAGAGGAAAKSSLATHMTFGNSLAVLGIGIPIMMGVFRWHRVLTNFKAKYFPNVLHVQLHTISRSPNCHHSDVPKFRVHTRTILERQLSDIIYNDRGIHVLQKASRRCRSDNPLIRINPIEDHHFVCNAILIKLNEQFHHHWFARDFSVKSIMDVPQYDVISAKQYVFALVSTLCLKQTSVFTPRSKQPFHMGKLRAFVIREAAIREMLGFLDGSCESLDIHNMSAEQWREYLDLELIESDSTSNAHRLFDYESRWHLLREVVKQYDLQEKTECGQLKWANPMCSLEIPTAIEGAKDAFSLFNPPLRNALHSYVEPLDLSRCTQTSKPY